MPDDQQIMLIFGIFFAVAVVFVIMVMVLANASKRARDQRTQNEYAERYRQKNATASQPQVQLNDEQKAKLDYIREWHKQRLEKEEYDRHQLDAEEHEHLGEEEHYEEIVGSLGEVNDEGCEDLAGVRFIAHDIAYEVTDDDHDYSKVARAMVLGDILNNPRFKKPHSRK